MQANIIRNERIKKHNVEPYHFKVLSSNIISPSETETKTTPNTTEPSEPVVEIETNLEQEEFKLEEPINTEPQANNDFVETLLKKTDELSDNIVKLQMKIESQEEEFEKRLAEEVQRAKEEGLNEGYEKAKAENEEILAGAQSQYARSVSLLEQECVKFQEFLNQTKEELPSTAIEVASEVIQKEVSKDSSSVASSLANALIKELESNIKIQLKVNPKDFSELQTEFEHNEYVELISDDAVSKGGVIVLSDKGNFDGSLDTRLKHIKQIMSQ